MRCLKTATIAAISVGLFAASAEAASLCTTPDEMAALRTAAVQQELMVAGLTCQQIDAYNRFVLAYRPELQKSDADLKTFFVRRDGARGEAEYDTFKTKLANLSSLSDIANGSGYCANTHAAFAMAMQGHQSLTSFIADQRLMIALPEQQLCTAEPMLARVEPATARSEEIKPPAQPFRYAVTTPVAVGGVLPHSLPASPYSKSPYEAAPGTTRVLPPLPPANYAPPPPPGDNAEDGDDGDDADVGPIPSAPQRPERPAVIQAQRDDGYGPPPAWGPRPYPRWYGQYPYYYYGR